MNTTERINTMNDLLKHRFNPEFLEIIDESQQHIGHEGSKSGKGHFKVIIQANTLNHLNRIEQHRLIYATLGTLMETDIHALTIDIQ